MRNTKRLLIVLLSLMLVFTALFALTSCGKCKHKEWNEATCTAPKTCKECGVTEGEALGHTGGTATCQQEAKCTRCNTAYGAKGAHDYSAATCVAPKTCKVCNATDGSALGHLDENKDHVCERTGCTLTVGTHADSDKDHACDYGCSEAIAAHAEGTVIDHVCDYCGKGSFGEHKAGTADVHICDYCGGGVSTCVDANKDHVCDIGCNTPVGAHTDANKDHVCDYGCTVAIGDHKDEDKDHVCDYGCAVALGEHKDENTDHVCDYGCTVALGTHADSETDSDHDCDYGCGEMLNAHVGGTATCSVQATCTVCNKKYGPLAPHDFSKQTEALAYVKTRANCTESAVYYYCCAVCGANERNDAHTFNGKGSDGHKFGAYVNLVEEGVEKHARTCTVCYFVDKAACAYNPTVPLAAGAENLGAPATCLSPAKCSVCAHEYGDAAGHDWDDGVVSAATCETAGSITYNCTVCENASKTEAIAPLGHAWGAGVETTPATCTTAGVMTYTCGNDAGHTKTEQIAPLGHTEGAAATCETAQLCTVCNALLANALGHNYVWNEDESTEATCTEAQKDVYTCDACGDSYDEIVGAPLGHSLVGDAWDVRYSGDDTALLCTYTEYKYCQTCEEDIVTKTFTSHDSWTAAIDTYATCTAPGRKTLTCPTCGTTEEEEIPVDLELGHAWDDGVTADGITTYTCTHDETHTKTVKTVTAEDTLTKDDLSNELQTDNGSFNLGGASEAIGDKEVNLSSGQVNKDELNLTPEQKEQIGGEFVYEFVITDKESGDTISQFGENNYVTVTLPYPEFNPDEDDADAIAIWFINDAGELEAIMATYNDGYVTFKTNHFSKYTVTRLKPAERCALYGHSSTFKIHLGSCLEDAYVLEFCVRCGYKNQITVWSPDDYEHAYDDGVTEPATCTTAGQTVYTCTCTEIPATIVIDEGVTAITEENVHVTETKVCGHTKTVKIPALNHNYYDTDFVDATCAEAGFIVWVCANDEAHTYTEILPQLSHDYDAVVTDPTCAAGGFTRHTCGNCGDFYDDTYTAPLAHTYSDFDYQWNDDETVVTLYLCCDNCSEGDISEPFALAELAKKEIKASCATDGKEQYFARLTVNGEAMSYLVKEVTLSSADAHEFSETINMSDEHTHWKGCKCGAKKDEAQHEFDAGIVTRYASCDAAGEIVYTCADCGYMKTEQIEKLEHSFVNGVCSACGRSAGKGLYVTLLESYKGMNGFALRIEDLFFEFSEDDEVDGRITLTLGELMLYTEDGKLMGAAKGSLVIYNGPITNADAYYALEAVIDGEHVYISLTGGATPDEQTMQLKSSVAELLAMMSGSMMAPGAMGTGAPEIDPAMIEGMVGFVNETLIPTVDLLLASNGDEAEEILEALFAMIFTVEKTDEGYVFTLDFDKIAALNANLATLSVSELIDLYFGDGSFDELVAFVNGLLDMKLGDIPAYVEGLGLDYEALIGAINELCAMTGAPAGFDIGEMIADPDYAELPLGLLLTNEESYSQMVGQIVQGLQYMPLYALFGEDVAPEEVQAMVDMVLSMLRESIFVSFTTDLKGSLTNIDLAVSDFELAMEDGTLKLSVALGITVNGKIEVTWGDIVTDINGAEVLPPEDMKDATVSERKENWSGEMEYLGEYFRYQAQIYTYSQKDFNRLIALMIQDDCTGWTAYQAIYGVNQAEYGLYMLYPLGGSTGMMIPAHILLIDTVSGEIIELVRGDEGLTAVYEDGTEVPVDPSLMSDEDIEPLIIALFGEITLSPVADDSAEVHYYYNKTAGEYATSNQHALTEKVEFLGEYCTDGIRYTYICSKCGFSYSYTNYNCMGSEETTIDFAELGACGGSADVYACETCGKVHSLNRLDIQCDFGTPVVESVLDKDGNKIGDKVIYTCSICGLVYSQQQTETFEGDCIYKTENSQSVTIGGEVLFDYKDYYWTEKHEYRYSYEFLTENRDCESGVEITKFCPKCGDEDSTIYSYHKTLEIERIEIEGSCHEDAYFTYEECACGKSATVERHNTCLYGGFGNSYEGDNGMIHHVTNWRCEKCGLTYRQDHYSVRDAETCTEVTYYQDSAVIGDTLIGEWTYETCRESHDEYVASAVLDGGESCEDGVTLIYACRDCSYTYESYTTWHETYEIARYDLQDPRYGGALHQGYLVERRCACGESHSVRLDTLCEIDEGYWEALWIEDAIGDPENGYYWSTFDTDGFYNGYSSEAWRQTCAVTDPEACGYSIRRARYWVKAEGACLAEMYETWQLGYDPATGTYAHEITYKTGESRVYHPYIVNEPENTIRPNTIRTTTYTCPDCQSSAYDRVTIGADGERIARVMYAENKTAYGDCKVREERYEYLNGCEFMMYRYVEYHNGEWETHEYDGFCEATETYTSSHGKGDSHETDRHYENWGWQKIPTCTQDGAYGMWCEACGKMLETRREEPAYDHSWQQQDENLWICTRCGIQNANGASGEVILEDLTALYGGGENYVAGYCINNGAEFGKYVALYLLNGVTVEGMDIVELFEIQVFELDNVRAVAFSMAAVRAAAEAHGLSPENYEVRLSFVPYDNLDEDDYGITFDKSYSEGYETVTGDVTVQLTLNSNDGRQISICPALGGIYRIDVYNDRGIDVILENAYGEWLHAGYLIECEMEENVNYTLRLSSNYTEFPAPVTVVITYVGAAE